MATPDPKGYFASRHVDLLDLKAAKGQIAYADGADSMHFLHVLYADEIRSLKRVLAGETVHDKDGNVRENPAVNITYTSGPNVNPPMAATNAQEALDELAVAINDSGSRVETVAHSRELEALTGTTTNDKLESLFPQGAPAKEGDLVFVGFQLGVKKDENDQAGMWMLRNGQWEHTNPLVDAIDSRIGLNFHRLIELEKAVTVSLLYRTEPRMWNQGSVGSTLRTTTIVDLTEEDLLRRTYELQKAAPYEGIELFLNGVRLVASTQAEELDYTIDYATSTIELFHQVPKDALIQIDVLVPPEMVVPGVIDIVKLEHFQPDGKKTVFPMRDENTAAAVAALDVSQIVLIQNGERLEPGKDYELNPTNVSEIQFFKPPKSTEDIWGLAYMPGKATIGGGGTGQLVDPDPMLQPYLLDYSWVPGKGMQWVDAREDMDVVDDVADLSDRLILPAGHLRIGKLVYVKSEGRLYEFKVDATTMSNTLADWKPLVNGLVYVGRAGNLPQTAQHGELFVVRMDFAGEDMYRLVSWDETITTNINYLAMTSLGHTLSKNLPATPVSPPDDLTITFSLPANSAIGQPGSYGFRVSWEEDSNPFTQSFVVPVTPGMTALDVASVLEAEFKAQLPNDEILPTQSGSVLTLTPRPAVAPVSPFTDVGPFTSSGSVPGVPAIGDWGEVTQAFALQGTPVPAGSTIFYVGGIQGWLIEHPTFAGGLQVTVTSGGAPTNYGASLTFAGGGNMSYFAAGGGGRAPGEYLIATAPHTFPATDPVAYPKMGNLAGQTVGIGDFLIFSAAPDQWIVAPNQTPDNDAIRAAYQTAGLTNTPQIVSLGGTMTPAPTPPVDYQEPGTSPHHITITDVVEASVASGPIQTPAQGGWRYLNREIWNKDLRANPDQQSDQRDGDLQVTREDQHEEIKAWNDTSKQWDTIYSRDEVNAAIAAMSLFEGTVQEVGGAAIGAVEFNNLPDLVAMSAANDLSDVSHYWTFVGSPNTVVDASTDQIGADLNGAVLNPGDWVQIANRGGDGSGAGVGGAPADLHWVTIGGDLLAKARADRLFGLQPWAASGWEQGSLVLFDGDIYRADQPVMATDPNPSVSQPTIDPITLPVHQGQSVDDWTTGLQAILPAAGNMNVGDWIQVISGMAMQAGGPFGGRNLSPGDRFVWTGNGNVSGTTDNEGIEIDTGWAYYPSATTTPPSGPTPDTVTTQPVPTPWTKVDISGGLKVAGDDAGLPGSAPAGEVWIVLSSAQAGSKQALFGYDAAALKWQELGGSAGGQPLDLTHGKPMISIGVPVGTIIDYAGNNIPDGWLKCDGSAYDPTVYPELKAVLGQDNVPDLVSYFTRGGSAATPYRQHRDETRMPRNSLRTGTEGGHQHTVYTHGMVYSHSGRTGGMPAGTDDTTTVSNSPRVATNESGDHRHPIHGGDPETVPKHVVVLKLIKASDNTVRVR